jgi:hypothetical protein
MRHALCLLFGALIASANIAGWALALRRLGKPVGVVTLVTLPLFFTLKLGLTALALYFILKAPWASLPGLLVGLGLPVMALAISKVAKPETPQPGSKP